MFTFPWRAGARAACIALLASSGLAQEITSPSGDWVAAFTSPASGPNGELSTLTGPNGGDGSNSVFLTYWYEATTSSGMLTRRVNETYTQISENIGANSASFRLVRNDGLLQLDVSVGMVDGPSGGAMYDLVWTNVGNNAIDVKPFAYAELDVDGFSSCQDAHWLPGTSAVEQVEPDTGGTIWFGSTGRPYKSWEIGVWSDLLIALDAGLDQLSNSGAGRCADFGSVLAGQAITLQPRDTTRLTFALGGAGIGRDCDACDMNCDGAIDAFDIEPFLGILFNGDPQCVPDCTGDVNADGTVDAFDIEPFLDCLFP